MPIAWDPIFSVHIEIIDRQHQRFIGILNQLDEAIKANKVKDELGAIFKELLEYAKVHFGTEEMYFDKFNYEGAVEHKAAHAKLVAEAQALYERYGQDDYQLSQDLIIFLEDWLTKHLAYMDKGYVKCFHEHGLR
jgi:hemerythrin-like metal-binding protein